MKKCLIFSLFLFVCFSQSFAQENEAPKLFINCANWGCYEDYVKTELSFFNYVRDRFEADIQILIINQQNGAGGMQYTLTFLGQNAFKNRQDTIRFSTKQADTDDMIRSQLVKNLKNGLFPFLQKTDFVNQIDVSFPKRSSAEAVIKKDKWNYWVFNIGANGWTNGESNQNSLNLSGNFGINRITAASKFNFSVNYRRNINTFTIDGTEYSAKTKSYNLTAVYVKSLTDHWAIGGYYQGRHSIFQNFDFTQKIAPALEYNIFPVTENTRRQFRWIYQAGVRTFDYIETTIYEKNNENLPYHQLTSILDLTQPWGTLRTVLTGSQFLHDPSKTRLSLNVEVSWRIIEGLSLYVYGGAEHIQDQISLAKSSVDPQIFLLNGRQLPTSFSYYTSFGINYTFGSINNSVVNPRFGSID